MRFYLVLLFILFTRFTGIGQTSYTSKSAKAIKYYEDGRSNYRLFYYDIAEDNLLKAIKADEKFIEPYMVLAKLYTDKNQFEKAVETYKSGLRIDTTFYPHGFLYQAELEIRLGRYQDALKSFNTLIHVAGSNTKLMSRGERGIQQAKFAIDAVKHPVQFNPIKLSSTINTDDFEYWPVLSADEQTLVFTRLVKSADGKKKQEDFYISTAQDGDWSVAKNAGPPLNTPDNEGAQTLSADGNFMVYTVCNQTGVIGRCDLYSSRKIGSSWTKPVNMGNRINTGSKETQPGLSADGRTLYFASDRPGGKGGMDIWFSTMDEQDVWSIPVNLGDSVNTQGDELSPFIHHDNATLYFSSDYWIGMGGADIFYSRRKEDGEWGRARNIGYPINTHRDEIGLIVNAKGNMAYYSSDIDSVTGRDIYAFELYKQAQPREVSYLKGKVFDVDTKRPLAAGFELFNLEDGKLVNKSISDEATGSFLLCIPTNCNYMLNVSKQKYMFYSDNFSLTGIHQIEKPFLKDIPLQPIKTGNTIILNNIFFETDAYQLKDESKYELLKLVRFLNENPGLKVEIGGHTDNIGSANYNQQLSERRAQSVVAYLKEQGIQTARLTAKGYGFENPVESNETAEGRAKNRRTELKILM